ncbi:MAG TPA: FABP family protein [Mycobacteriales bacterium]|nr:FABP family protein [Mycobacteriales bacterium]
MDLPAALQPLEFLLGTWRGTGEGSYPTIPDFAFTQEITFVCYGKPVLAYTSRTWASDDGRPLAHESGYWRPAGDGTLEVMLAHPTGVVEVFYGEVTGQRVEIATDAVVRTRTAKEVTAEHRLYGLVGAELMYVEELAAVGEALQPHVSARLQRVQE